MHALFRILVPLIIAVTTPAAADSLQGDENPSLPTAPVNHDPVPLQTVLELERLFAEAKENPYRVDLMQIQPSDLEFQLKLIAQLPDQLQLESVGEDPILLLGELPVGDHDFLMRVQLNVPRATLLQVFFTTDRELEFSEDRSVRCDLVAGKNTLVLPLVSPDRIGSVRLDPTTCQGLVEINSITFKPLPKGTLTELLRNQVALTPPAQEARLSMLLWLFVLLVLAGLAPSFLFRGVLNIDNAGLLFAVSFLSGSCMTILVLLTLGQIGLRIMGWPTYATPVALALLSLGFVASSAERFRMVRTWLKSMTRLDLRGLYCWMCLVALYGGFLIVNQKHYFPNWDHFSFWLTDAKLIYLNGTLRMTTDVISKYHYSAYYPLHAAMIYQFAGGIFEQYASLFTIAYGFCGSVLAFAIVPRGAWLTRNLTMTVVLLLNLCFAQNHRLIFSMYADVYFAVLVVLFMVLLMRDVDARSYAGKCCLVLFVFMVMMLVKPTNIYYVIILAGTFILYEWKRFATFFQEPLAMAMLAGTAMIGLLLYGTRTYYLKTAFSGARLNRVRVLPAEVFEIGTYWEYLREMVVYLGSHLYLPIVVAVFVLATLFMRARISRAAVFSVCALAILPVLNIVHWLSIQKNLHTGSLQRYVTTTFFAVPLLLGYAALPIPKDSWRWRLSAFFPGMMTLMCLTALFSWHSFSVPFHNGSYMSSRWLRPHIERTQVIEKTLGEHTVMFCSVLVDGKISNEIYEGYCFNYFLPNNVVGGTYRVPSEAFGGMVARVKPDFLYVYLLQPDEFLDGFIGLEARSEALVRVVYEPELTFEVVPFGHSGPPSE